MAWVKICRKEDLHEGQAAAQDFPRVRVAVLRHQGELYAIDDICPHRQGYLSDGPMEDGTIICPLHAWQFDLKTGGMKGQAAIRIRTFEWREREGDIEVELEDVLLEPLAP